MDSLKVSHIMDSEVMAISVAMDSNIMDVTEQFNKFNISSALVIDYSKDEIAGIITERDIVRGLQREGGDVVKLTARDCATIGPIKTVKPGDPLQLAALTMLRAGIRHIPVMHEDEHDNPIHVDNLAGILSIRDVLYVHYYDEVTGGK